MPPTTDPPKVSERPRTASVVLSLIALTVLLTGCGDPTTPPASPSEPVTMEDQGPLFASVETDRGDFRFKLRPDRAPISCANFVNLVQRGYFDDLAFYRHSRVIRQVGNPFNDEDQRYYPGYSLAPEFAADLKFDRGGMVAMVRLGDDPTAMVRSNEFFVTTKPQSERYTFKYPIFGEVVEGQDVVIGLLKDDMLRRITIEGDPTPLLEVHADQIAQWNGALDFSPDPRK
jgi:peptidyl-prolyl cis-trans isomerase B (cyclophilin B)